MSYAELAAATNFSFLRGASTPADMVGAALAQGLAGIGIADRNSVAGVVRAWQALRDAEAAGLRDTGQALRDFRLVTGARLVFADGTPDIIAFPATRYGWGRLCRLLTAGNLKAEKGSCILALDDLIAHLDDLLLIVLAESSADPAEQVPHRTPVTLPADPTTNILAFPATAPPAGVEAPVRPAAAGPATVSPLRHAADPPPAPGRPRPLPGLLARLQAAAPGRIWLGATCPRDGRDRRRLARLGAIADGAGVPLLAINDCRYAEPADRPLQDVLTAIRLGRTIDRCGRLLAANAEAHVKTADEMRRLFADRPEAVDESLRLIDRIGFDLGQLRYRYPDEPVPPGWTPLAWLKRLVGRAAGRMWPQGIGPKVHAMLTEEFALIASQDIACYFLTVHDIVRFARGQQPPILCQGRGSAANSMVCYLLGVTSVDPAKHDLLFSRFLSEDRNEPPDIDVDFEHERREEVMQYIYRRYGRHRAGIVATVIHYRPRSAVREAGKALGLTEDVTQRLTGTIWGSFASRMEPRRFTETGFSIDNPEIARLNHFVTRLLGAGGPADREGREPAAYPRHLSQHVGGFVLTQDRLDETVPLHNAAMPGRTFIEWDKDDIDVLRLMKVDVLALGMLTCIAKAFDLIRADGGPDYTLATLPWEAPDVYDMLCRGDSLGVFQVESRAQMNMLPRLKPRELYDLVVQVAIVRPGPIQGDMVHPYLRRRAGIEDVECPSPAPPHDPDELQHLLGRTFGVPLFQEQAMKLAIVAAGFSSGEANQLRKAMATFRHVGGMDKFREKLVGGMVRRGYQEAFAERCYRQIEGFGSYGFPESHAQSFARLVYVSSYIKCRYPAAFCAALLNSQPMGFYAPAQIVRDATQHGVTVRPVDVAASGWDNALEADRPGRPAVRLGLRQIDGFRAEWAQALVAVRARLGMADAAVEALAQAVPARALRLLADADAFRGVSLGRRDALWAVRRQPAGDLPLFAAAAARALGEEADAALPAMPLSEQVAADYQTTRLSLKAHPLGFLRGLFAAEGVRTCAALRAVGDGRRARVAGVVLVRQRPGRGNAIFVTLEDETGVANLLLWARIFEEYRRPVMAARLMLAEGVVQVSPEGVVHLMVDRVEDRTRELDRLSATHATPVTLSRADEFAHPQHPRTGVPHGHRHPRDVRILPASRDFH